MSTPFTLPLHTILDHEGRKIQYQGHLGDDLLSFTDVRSGSPVTVIDPVTGAKGMATFEWVAQEYAAGRLSAKPLRSSIGRAVRRRSPALMPQHALPSTRSRRGEWRGRLRRTRRGSQRQTWHSENSSPANGRKS